jgi:hypothetical protein
MTPEHPPETSLTTPPSTPGLKLRPPDLQLPKSERHAERSGGAKVGLYISSGGQTYGPSTPREVVASVRTGYFHEDAVFWVESRNEWRPLTELAQHVELPPTVEEPAYLELPPRIPLHSPLAEAITPKWPGASRPSSAPFAPSAFSSSSSSPGGERRRRKRTGKKGKASKKRWAGPLIVLGLILLLILITAWVLMFLSGL